jgi:threonine/homoserine/homoserine lactone efflux protein
MSLFGWALVFVGLALASAAALGWIGVQLWRRVKALGRAAAATGDAFARLGSDAGSLRD